ncbi:hypothetical protein KSS87_023590, partial [Heliosperma pusillum]
SVILRILFHQPHHLFSSVYTLTHLSLSKTSEISMASNNIRPPQPQALNVPPLNSMPYIDPIASMCLSYDNKYPADTKTRESAKPALVYLPSQPTKEEWHNILSVTSNGIGLTGSAAAGTMGPILGKRDIGECEDSYIFRVSLPGVAREDFNIDVLPNGKVLIKGATTTGEKTAYKHSLKFEMQSQNLSPPGVFTITFNLPGPVDSPSIAIGIPPIMVRMDQQGHGQAAGMDLLVARVNFLMAVHTLIKSPGHLWLHPWVAHRSAPAGIPADSLPATSATTSGILAEPIPGNRES